jgi:hypothetical protein
MYSCQTEVTKRYIHSRRLLPGSCGCAVTKVTTVATIGQTHQLQVIFVYYVYYLSGLTYSYVIPSRARLYQLFITYIFDFRARCAGAFPLEFQHKYLYI